MPGRVVSGVLAGTLVLAGCASTADDEPAAATTDPTVPATSAPPTETADPAPEPEPTASAPAPDPVAVLTDAMAASEAAPTVTLVRLDETLPDGGSDFTGTGWCRVTRVDGPDHRGRSTGHDGGTAAPSACTGGTVVADAVALGTEVRTLQDGVYLVAHAAQEDVDQAIGYYHQMGILRSVLDVATEVRAVDATTIEITAPGTRISLATSEASRLTPFGSDPESEATITVRIDPEGRVSSYGYEVVDYETSLEPGGESEFEEPYTSYDGTSWSKQWELTYGPVTVEAPDAPTRPWDGYPLGDETAVRSFFGFIV
ncbi:hypothetical protein [Sanguibacter suaedae]|uniref:Lipoprotein n=1 Tax=Sanguibacter suaedae TaxID=2795737 RepID=A0A934IAA8_9MICO|nr:hypothetical protein [Sanguibacter suaedae]MBI9114090.1 hypothetical protein [Sanguibacter suaedae]